MKRTIIFLLIVAVMGTVVLMNGCSAAKQVSQAYNLTQCEYSYNSLGALNIGGIDAMKAPSLGTVTQIGTLLAGGAKSIPLAMTVNVNVKNPNMSTAAMNGMDYILSIDGVQFTEGEIQQPFEVGAGSTAMLPVTIGVDIAQLLKSDSADAVVNIAKNLLGVGDRASKVTLQIKPNVKVAGYIVPSPVYVPISFEFGGKK